VAQRGGHRSLSQIALSVLVPAFNEARCIEDTLGAIGEQIADRVAYWEIIVVDDGSTDETAQIVRSLPRGLNVTLVRLSRNFGKEAALKAGLDYARGDVVVVMDADGQHPPDKLVPMLERWWGGYDMVYGVREDRQSESRFKRWGAKLFYSLLSTSSHTEMPADAGDFRLMDRRVVDALRSMPERNRFTKGMYAWVGFRSIALPYIPLPRSSGKSTYTKLKLAALAVTGFTGFSALPLRLASAVGLLLALLALAYGAEVIFDRLVYGEDLRGWPTIVASIMFFSGVQLLFIGVLGEYLARVFDEVKGRPNYIVAEIVRPGQQAGASR
jgi:glycosyltransferase involved in cell wall biosynthesis